MNRSLVDPGLAEQQRFMRMSNTDKLGVAIRHAAGRLPAQARDHALALVDPTNLAIMAGALAIWVGAQATPVGWVVNIAMMGAGVVAVGAQAVDVARELRDFALGVLGADNTADLRAAGDHLAKAVAMVGVDMVVALLLKKAIVKVREPKMPTPDGSETKLLFGKYDPRTAQRSLPPERPLKRPVSTHASVPPAEPVPKTRREVLVEKYRKSEGLTGDVNTDINIKSRKALARKFYEDAGYSGQRLEGHLKGIDYSKDVELYTLSKGRPVAQWQSPGGPTGSYFSRPGGDPAKMGIDHAGRELLTYAPKERVTVLKSTAADMTSWKDGTTVYKGGETQYFTGQSDLFDLLK